MSVEFTSDQWWKNGVVYCLDVQTFLDHDGDGMGDLRGLIDRIDYLAGIGVSTLWLMPFYPTPDQDDGSHVCWVCETRMIPTPMNATPAQRSGGTVSSSTN